MADDVFEVDLESLKVREIEEIEEITGIPLSEMLSTGKPLGKSLRAIAYVVRKRTDPSFTLEAAGELVINLQAAPVDPTNAAGS